MIRLSKSSPLRQINVCAGIGDNIWILQKLLNAGEGFEYLLPDGKPQRGKQIFDMLPPEIATGSYTSDHKGYNQTYAANILHTKSLWSEITESRFTLTFNEHLEKGGRIEKVLPDLPTRFRIDWNTGNDLPVNLPNKPMIGIYGSSYSTTRAWGFWKEDKWFRLIQILHKANPDFVYIIIGADWDLNLGGNLIELLSRHDIPYINTIGRPLGYVTELLKKLSYLFSFPSGIGILATTVQCPVTMFYPNGKNGAPDYTPMMNAWASPEDIESGAYKGAAFCEPEPIFKWVMQEYKLLQKLKSVE